MKGKKERGVVNLCLSSGFYMVRNVVEVANNHGWSGSNAAPAKGRGIIHEI